MANKKKEMTLEDLANRAQRQLDINPNGFLEGKIKTPANLKKEFGDEIPFYFKPLSGAKSRFADSLVVAQADDKLLAEFLEGVISLDGKKPLPLMQPPDFDILTLVHNLGGRLIMDLVDTMLTATSPTFEDKNFPEK